MTKQTRDQAFILARSEALARAWLRNLMRMRSVALCEPARQADRSGTVLIVGAGPSLEVVAVAEAQRRGCSIWTVNTALPALAVAGIAPDVVVTRELVDVSSHMQARPYGLLVADIGARPESIPDTALFVIPESAALFNVARALGIQPIDCGPSAITMAMALASLSAARIELHGVDCCYAADGATYHGASAFADRRAVLEGERVMYEGEGQRVKQAQHAAGGVGPPLARETVHDVALRRGGFGKATRDLIEQREWMEAHALKGMLECVDASGGARKRGWTDVEEAGPAAGSIPALAAVLVDDDDRAAVRTAIIREAEYLGTVAVNVMHPDGDPGAVPPVPAGIARALATADMLRMRMVGAPVRTTLLGQYGAWARAADEVAATLGHELHCAADYERACADKRRAPTPTPTPTLHSVAQSLAALAERHQGAERVAYETAADAVANVVQRAILATL